MAKVGIIGLGRMGMLHLMNCLQTNGVKVVAAADRSKKALKKAESFGVNGLYRDYHDLLNRSSDMDAVVISLPIFLARAIAMKEKLGNSNGIITRGGSVAEFKKIFPRESFTSSKYWWGIQFWLLKVYHKITGDVIPPVLEEA